MTNFLPERSEGWSLRSWCQQACFRGGLSPWLVTTIFSFCLQMVFPLCLPVSSTLVRTPVPLDQGPDPMTLLHLYCLFKGLSPNAVEFCVLGVRISTHDLGFGGNKSTHNNNNNNCTVNSYSYRHSPFSEL